MRRWIDRVRLRVRSLLRGSDVDAALQREIRQHLDERNRREPRRRHERFREGANGRLDARLRSDGGIEEELPRHPAALVSSRTWPADLRYTLRSLARQPLLVVAATISIAVAVGANTTIFSLATRAAVLHAHDPPARGARAHPDGKRQPRLVQGSGRPLQGERRAPQGLRRLSGSRPEVNWHGTRVNHSAWSRSSSRPTSSTCSACRSRWAAGSRRPRPDAGPQSQRRWSSATDSGRGAARRQSRSIVGRTLIFQRVAPSRCLGVLPRGLRAFPATASRRKSICP